MRSRRNRGEMGDGLDGSRQNIAVGEHARMEGHLAQMRLPYRNFGNSATPRPPNDELFARRAFALGFRRAIGMGGCGAAGRNAYGSDRMRRSRSGATPQRRRSVAYH